MMRVLLTGFEAFGPHVNNPSGDLVRFYSAPVAKPEGFLLRSALLPVAYHRVEREFDSIIADFLPDMVLSFGLGQEGPLLTFETMARNMDACDSPDNDGELRQGTEIRPGDPATLTTPLPVEDLLGAVRQEGIDAVSSVDAGNYVCNHLFFHALSQAYQDSGPPLYQAGFIHLSPHASTVEGSEMVKRAIAILLDRLNRLRNQQGEFGMA